MNALLDAVFNSIGTEKKDLASACQRAGIDYATAVRWQARKGAPRLDLFLALAEVAGYEITMTDKFRIVYASDNSDKSNIYRGNKLVGYLEDDRLYGIGMDGYAEEIGECDHPTKIAGMLKNHASSRNTR